jgi:large subunit ribosomal protein L23
MPGINGVYAVEIDSRATKIDVKKAIKEIYDVEISDVRVVSVREKFKFLKKGVAMKRKPSKKAYITLKDEKAKIDFTITK